MKIIVAVMLFACLYACKGKETINSVELISSVGRQDSLFRSLMAITDYGIQENSLNDSLAFLILPVQASCPSCRKKTIDSLLKYHFVLKPRHYVVITAGAGYKTMNRYFLERDTQLQAIPGKLFIDSNNLAYRHDLFKDNPAMYYTYDRRAYKKVFAIPATVKADLREFFSGRR